MFSKLELWGDTSVGPAQDEQAVGLPQIVVWAMLLPRINHRAEEVRTLGMVLTQCVEVDLEVELTVSTQEHGLRLQRDRFRYMYFST